MRCVALLALTAALAAVSITAAPAMAAIEEVTPAPTPVNTGAPNLTGTPTPGQTLTCSTGTWSGNPSTFSYAWLRDGVAISGQTGSTYVVQAADQGHSISCQVTASNGGGEYTIVGLPSASYKVDFIPFEGNYLFQYYSGQSTEATATAVNVTAPSTTSGINAEMRSGGQITGKVTALPGGAPIANAEACAEEEHVGGGCAFTNGGGEYTIVGLPTGSYTVTFYASEGNHLQQSYGSLVTVTAGSPTSNIDAALATGGEISGRLTAETGGGPIAGAEACAFEHGVGFFGGCATTNSNGEYTIEGLPSGGEYAVTFDAFGCGEASCTQQNYLSKAVGPVSVSAGSTTPSVDAALATGGQISGTVSGAEGGANVEACAEEPVEGYFECANTNAGGEYTIPALNTGEYEVNFSPTFACGANGCIRPNYVSQPYGANPVSVLAGSTATKVNATMATAGKISGRITAEAGGGAVAGEACAFEPTGHVYGGCTAANSNGEYTLQGLPTGTYEVTFYGESCAGEGCTQLNYVRKTVTGVSVADGSTTPNVDAALATGGEITGRVTDANTHAALASVEVCASALISTERYGGCASTTSAAKSAAIARSNSLAVPTPVSKFKLMKAAFDAKSGDLVFTFQFVNAGKLSWQLFFRNSDVAFADSFGISPGEGVATAETAKRKGKAKRCKKGFAKHAGKCLRLQVVFSSGSDSVAAGGTVKVKVHASKKALKALKSGHTLHVSGTFTFQSALGGKPVTDNVATVVHPPKKKGKHGKHSKHGG